MLFITIKSIKQNKLGKQKIFIKKLETFNEGKKDLIRVDLQSYSIKSMLMIQVYTSLSVECKKTHK